MNRKRILALALLLVLALGLTACGKSDQLGVEDTWKPILETISMGDDVLFSATLKDMSDAEAGVEPSMVLERGGTGTFDLSGGDPMQVQWSRDGSTLTLTAEAESMELIYDETSDQFTLTLEENGLTATIQFAREGSAAVASARTTSAVG